MKKMWFAHFRFVACLSDEPFVCCSIETNDFVRRLPKELGNKCAG